MSEANQKLKLLTITDELTQIHNKAYGNEESEKMFNLCMDSNRDFSVIFFDLDFFKKYNDYYGHLLGDKCLKQVALAIKEFCRNDSVFFRFGGEEFVLVLPNTNLNGARTVADKMRQKIEELKIPHIHNEISDYVTISIGVHTIEGHYDISFKEVLGLADQALYEAKKTRNTVCYKLHAN